ncbi:MAG: hypothetical protein J6U93_05450 [Alistipes sp.]|nr:hypothetical protein [Alistipes sp.]
MKKLFALLALVLGVVSCQTEPEGFDVNVGGEQDVNITVSLPESTRAASNQGFDFTNLGDYSIRYILEIAYNGHILRDAQISKNSSATFPVRLAPGREYTFTVWADLVTATTIDKANWSATDNFYNTSAGLSNITFNTWTPNTEARDAWTDTKKVTFTGASDVQMNLTRPFAKVRVVATDIAEIRKFGIEPTNAVAEYFTAEMYTKFNAVTGVASEAATKKHEFNYTDETRYESITDNYQFTVFTDYVFVPEDGNVQFTLNVYDNKKGDDALIKANSFNTTIPVERNKVTSIVGDVLTEGGNVKVTVDGTLGVKETYTYISSGADLIKAMKSVGKYILGNDIDVDENDLVQAGLLSATRSTTETVINLNGYTITVKNTSDTALVTVAEGNTLTFIDTTGEGAIVLADDSKAFIENKGEINIEGGEISGNDTASVIDNDGTANVSGGELNNGAIKNNGTTSVTDGTINEGAIENIDNGTTEITGGEFTYTPSDDDVAEGFEVKEENGKITIVESAPVAQIGSEKYTTLKAAFEAVESGQTIKLLSDVTVKSTAVLAEGKKVTLNLNSKTISHKDVETAYVLNNKGVLTINGNGVINARGIYNGYGDGGDNITTAKLTITNGTFNAKGTNGGAAVFNYGEVEVKGGKFESNGGYGLNNQSTGTLKISGGEIRGGIYNLGTLTIDGDKASVYQHLSGKHAIYCSASTTTINGGSFDSESGNELILADGEGCSVTINGGVFNKTAKSWLMGAAIGKNITFNIYGGTFNGYVNMPEQTVDTFRPYGDPIVAYGGVYNFNPTNWVASDYKAKQKVDNTYVVIEDKIVAKVGNTEYDFIDEAIAAWTNNTTLTLLSDVTLNDVVTLMSTEHHTLNLGTYTLTAAKGKDAIEITCNGRTSASYALTINADATNPGGITATGTSCIYYKKSGSAKDRPIILINNGVFTGSYSINITSNGNTNCPQVWINAGVFNSYMNLTKTMLQVKGGTFHAAINCTGDQNAYRLFAGGRFKSWQFMTADAPNKFAISSKMSKDDNGNWIGTYDVGVYVDDEGYLVVGGPVITEFGDQFVAKATNPTKWSSYLKYSSAAEHGLYYTNADVAIAKHGEANVVLK